MTRKVTMLGLTVLLGVAFVALAGESEHSTTPVSIVSLISQPKDFVGRRVSVSGYLSRSSNLYLYLSRGHAQVRDAASAILIDSNALPELERQKCLERYVTVSGDFGVDAGGDYALLTLDEVYIPSDEWVVRACWVREPEEAEE